MFRLISLEPKGIRALAILLMAGVLVYGVTALAAPLRKPNIILVIGDDHGYRDFGFMGSEAVETPSLDRLASEGMVFTNGQSTSSICRPAIRSLLTGLQPDQWSARIARLKRQGIRRSSEQQIQSFETLPGLLQKVGYRSYLGGKIFSQGYQIAGFTHGVEIEVNADGIFGEAIEIGRQTLQPIFDFLDRHGREPFFLWYAPMLPHIPHNAPAQYEKPFEGKGYSESAVKYYAAIARFDLRLGELLTFLDEKGLRENTLIVYASDNGWDQTSQFEGDGVHDGPQGKMTLYETGTRTPIVFNWPGRILPGTDPVSVVSLVDLFPTILDYAGTTTPSDREGISMRPVLEQRGEWNRKFAMGSLSLPRPNANRPESLPPQSLHRSETGYFLRDTRWRYIWNQIWGSQELYDVIRDPDQTKNLVAEQTLRVKVYHDQIMRWRKRMSESPGAGASSRMAPKKTGRAKRVESK